MLELFTSLTSALQDNILIALGASLIWGVLSIVLSPCHLSSIPLIIGFISGQKNLTYKKSFIYSLLFSIGILITIIIIGVITSLAGRMLGDIGKWGNIFVAVIFFIIGLYLLDLIKFPFLNKISQPEYYKKGYIASFILGFVFGLALGPCTFAYMAPMLGIIFKISSSDYIKSIMMILFYAIGHCGVIVLAGTFTRVIEKYLKWNEKSKGIIILKRICGLLVIAGGVYLIFSIL